ncbi:FAD-dependent oxidoreductase [bacterium]|nr:FAD-dependent oxidoreductase [candidate division CSSED10-310 bacterium]
MSDGRRSGERFIIIGGVAAGMSAASKARRLRPDAEIVVFQDEEHVSYSACGLPYFISDRIAAASDLIAYDAAFFRRERNIDVRLRHRVTAIDAAVKCIRVVDLESGTSTVEPYDRLMIATGAAPVIPPLPGVDLRGVGPVRSLADGMRIKQLLAAGGICRAVIAGGGHIGLEMAEALRERNLQVLLVEKLPRLMANMDEEFSRLIEQHLTGHGVEVNTGTGVQELLGSDSVTAVRLESGDVVDAELVLLAVGVKPNSRLAAAAGIRLGATGAIAVNDRMETDIPDIYAGGDCAEAFHLVLQAPAYIPLGTTANKQGKVAGTNLAGGDASFPGIVGSSVFKCFDLEVARTGLTTREAELAGFDPVTAVIRQGSKAQYYPGAKPIIVKVVADRSSGRLLGAQMAGEQGVAKRIDTFATALTAGMTARQAADLDLAYAPPFSPVRDPVLIAAEQLDKQLS